MSSTRGLVVVLVVAACGDNLEDLGLRSGSRLRLVEYVTDDGSTTVDARVLYDTALHARCVPVEFSDGARHCLPEDAGGETVFLNAECSRPLGRIGDEDPVPTFIVRRFPLHGEQLPSRIYRRGDEVDAPAQYWEQRDGYCLGPLIDATGRFFSVSLTDALPASALAVVREVGRVEGDEIDGGRDASDDGLARFGALYMGGDNQPCDLIPAGNGATVACIRPDLPAATYFAEDTCIQPLVPVGIGERDEVSRVVLVDERSHCNELAGILPIMVVPPSVHQLIGARCVPVPSPVGKLLYMTGIPVAPPTFARQITGKGRIRAITLVDGRLRVPDQLAHDDELAADCRFTPTGDGHYACVPEAPLAVSTVFSDPSCSRPVPIAFVPDGACAPPERFVRDGDARREVLEPYTQPFYELEPGDRCGTYEAPPATRAHAVGPVLPDTTWARANLDIDNEL